MNFLVLHGPNLNLLGERPGDPRGQSLADVDQEIQRRAAELNVSVKLLQSNHEGALVDALHAERQWMDGAIINPAALCATSYALRDAIAAVRKPVYEVHLVELRKMEAWRRKSVLKEVCKGQIAGKGVQSYLTALERLAGAQTKAAGGKGKRALGRAARSPAALAPVIPSAAALPTKTLGRRPAAAAVLTLELKKTLGPAPTPATGKVTGTAPTRMSQLGFLTRELVRQKIAERLAGRLSPAALATWARAQWQEVQRGAPAESGQRELLEDLLQSLVLSAVAAHQLTDDQLIELMTRLDG